MQKRLENMSKIVSPSYGFGDDVRERVYCDFR